MGDGAKVEYLRTKNDYQDGVVLYTESSERGKEISELIESKVTIISRNVHSLEATSEGLQE